jgi:hypothetical protein
VGVKIVLLLKNEVRQMTATKVFLVEQHVRVRSAPALSGQHLKWLSPGEQISVDTAARQEADGYVWWQHAAGWSAERSLTDDSEIYLREVPQVAETAARRFHVGIRQVRVRSAPTLRAAHVKWLNPDEEVDVDPASQQEADGFIWWRHADGWSAERNASGSLIFLVEIEAAPTVEDTSADSTDADDPLWVPAEEAPATEDTPPAADGPLWVPAEESTPTTDTTSPTGERDFVVGKQMVRVRSGPTLSAAHVRWLLPGEQITTEVSSRTEADGYIWYQHAAGWSAERSLDGSEQYLYDPEEFANRPLEDGFVSFTDGLPDVDALPMRDALFTSLPVPLAQTQWWQYFGNNVYAYNLWASGKTWYAYAQGLHGGLDFGNSTAAVPVVAGTTGTFIKRETRYTKPNGMWVKVDDYTVIYGHLANVPTISPGAAINPDTVLGTLDVSLQRHLHLEVRYRDKWIVNPLLLMPEAMRNSLIAKFPPGPDYFYQSATWQQWIAPLDQPVLELSGALIGPHAG